MLSRKSQNLILEDKKLNLNEFKIIKYMLQNLIYLN